jgi:hypothetical protein
MAPRDLFDLYRKLGTRKPHERPWQRDPHSSKQPGPLWLLEYSAVSSNSFDRDSSGFGLVTDGKMA